MFNQENSNEAMKEEEILQKLSKKRPIGQNGKK